MLQHLLQAKLAHIVTALGHDWLVEQVCFFGGWGGALAVGRRRQSGCCCWAHTVIQGCEFNQDATHSLLITPCIELRYPPPPPTQIWRCVWLLLPAGYSPLPHTQSDLLRALLTKAHHAFKLLNTQLHVVSIPLILLLFLLCSLLLVPCIIPIITPDAYGSLHGCSAALSGLLLAEERS